MPAAIQVAFAALLVAAGLFHYARFSSRLPARVSPKVDFGGMDAFLAGTLALWIIAQTVGNFFGRRVVVTPQAIQASMALYFCIVATIVGVLVGRDRNPIALFGLHWTSWRRDVPFVFGSLLAAYPVIFLPVLLMTLAGVEAPPQDVVEYLKSAKGPGEQWPMIAFAVVAAPVCEEFLFRGYLHGVLRKYSGRWISLVVISLIFSAMHGHLPALAPLAIFGMALGLVYEKTGSLWAPILMHATFNLTTVVVALTWPGTPI